MAGLVDFAATQSADINFAGAWGDVQAQLVHEQGFDVSALKDEASAQAQNLIAQGQSIAAAQTNSIFALLQQKGGDVTQINSAKIAFVDSFSQLSSQGFGLSGGDAVGAAKAYVLAGQTVAGAIGTVGSLINTVEHSSPMEVAQAFTGTMIGIAVAAGAVSAGVGAAIVGAVTAVLGVLQAAGLFTVSADPTWAFYIGGVGINPQNPGQGQVAPGAVNWRRFPIPGNGKITPPSILSVTPGTDADWYVKAPGMAGALKSWKGLVFAQPHTIAPIDSAYPAYTRVSKDAISVKGATGINPGSDFQKGFFSAWKANAEYALNGLKPQSDEQVLIHLLRMWNRAHAPPFTMISQSSRTYANSLVNNVLNQLSSNDPLVQGRNLILATGARKTPTIAPAVIVAAKQTIDAHLAAQIQLLNKSTAPKPVTLPSLVLTAKATAPVSKKSPTIYTASGGAIAGFFVGGPLGAGIGAGIGYVAGKLWR